MSDSLCTCEVVSDLMDARLSEQAFSNAVQQMAADEQAREAWHTYHLVGDVLRSSDLASGADEAGFLSRFQERLREEAATGPIIIKNDKAANDARFPWKWVAGLASFAVVAAASWNMVDASRGSSSAPQWVQVDRVPSSAVVVENSNEAQVMLRDPRLDQLLMAHRQSGGLSALQVPSGFLRNATFEVSSRQSLQN